MCKTLSNTVAILMSQNPQKFMPRRVDEDVDDDVDDVDDDDVNIDNDEDGFFDGDQDCDDDNRRLRQNFRPHKKLLLRLILPSPSLLSFRGVDDDDDDRLNEGRGMIFVVVVVTVLGQK